MENGFINEFGIKIVLKSFEGRVLIFTTSIENLYIFKVTKHKGDCRNNQSQRSHSKMWIKSNEIDKGSIEMDIQKSLKKSHQGHNRW